MIAFLTTLLLTLSWGQSEEKVFRFHLVSEPSSLKSWEQKNSGSSYLLNQLIGGLLVYHNQKITGNLAEKCFFKKPTLVHCQIKKDARWSDGQKIEAKHFVLAFQEMLKPENRAPQADLLFSVKNAAKVFAGELPMKELKIKAISPALLEIELEQVDSEFLYTLANPLTAPIPSAQLPSVEEIRRKPELWLSSGPYQIEQWQALKKIRLKPNPYYWKKNQRPPLEILTVPEDSVALSLYEKGELSFLRRLPTLYIEKFKDRPDFFKIDQFRFDYLGFSAKWRESLPLRRAIARAIAYPDLQTLFQSKGKPGCVGIPRHLTTSEHCLQYDLVEAISEWSNFKEKPKKFEILYSKQGGDDNRRSMEWLQTELAKNLKLKTEVNGLDNQIFVDRLQRRTPDLFRKGIAPTRPTCLSALENFASLNAENYIQFSHPRYDELMQLLRKKSDPAEKKKLCSEAIQILLSEFWIIPTGPIHFTLLASPQWTGWRLNELNQLDLSDLKPAAKTLN